MTGDGFLHRYFLNNASRPLNKWLHYFDIYERHFARFRGKSPTMIEIGVSGGGSLEMWRAYFGEGCKIVGIDINPECKTCEAKDIEVFVGSQDDPATIDAIFAKYPTVDIVLDDGSHLMPHMIASFVAMYHRIAPDGIYAVEDAHTCYWSEYGGGLRRDGSFMEFVKHKLDEINAAHGRGQIPVSAFTRSTNAVVCYDSMVVFEKRPQGHRQAPVTLAMR
jgi:hypothetical protein